MIWLRPHIATIKHLFEADTVHSLTYAALECRLAIELVCYDRLRIAHDYISHDDLKKWQPKDVVKKLIQDVDTNVASTFTLSISTRPADDVAGEMTRQDFEKFDYVPVGTQVGFDVNKIGRMWNALSSFLHVTVPRSTSDTVAAYGKPDAIKRKVAEVIAELERLATGTLTMSGIGETVNFQCNCGTHNKRRAGLLHHGQTVNCINPDCTERWDVVVDGDAVNFQRRSFAVHCRRCRYEKRFGERPVVELPRNTVVRFVCDQPNCGETNYIRWQLMQVAPIDAEGEERAER